MTIFLKTEDEINLMRKANQLVGRALAELGKYIQPGVTTLHLDRIAEEFIRDNGAIPTFKNFPNPYGEPFPASICTSINDVVVHGIPSDIDVLQEGDIISIDCGTLLDGFNGDSCYTFAVGEITDDKRKLLQVTKESLARGIESAIAGNHVGDIGFAIQNYCQSFGYGVVRELTGHGIGKAMHEDPSIPNFGKCGNGVMLKDGMCIAIEPMITMGDRRIGMLPDKWSIVTLDHLPAAHFEHTIVVRKGKAEILSSFIEVEHLEGQNF